MNILVNEQPGLSEPRSLKYAITVESEAADPLYIFSGALDSSCMLSHALYCILFHWRPLYFSCLLQFIQFLMPPAAWALVLDLETAV